MSEANTTSNETNTRNWSELAKAHYSESIMISVLKLFLAYFLDIHISYIYIYISWTDLKKKKKKYGNILICWVKPR